MRAAWITATAAATLLIGCAALRPAPQVRTFRLAYPAPAAAGLPALPVTVRVVPFGIAAAYDRQAFTYREGDYGVGVDYYNRWLGSPASLITDLVARDLAASGRVQAVLQAPSALPSDYELNGQIETLEEQGDGGGCVAHLRLRIFLVRAPAEGRRHVVLQDDFAADEVCHRGDPSSYAQSMSRAVQQVSDALRTAAVGAIAQDVTAR
jgi:ABC-type uncharacterized transport system auxiliary subunit